MSTQVLLGNPCNLYVFDFGASGTGSARFTGDEEDIQRTWELVQHNASINGSQGSLYRRPASQSKATVIPQS